MGSGRRPQESDGRNTEENQMSAEQIRSQEGPAQRMRAVNLVALGLSLFTAAVGAWALAAPRSFFDAVAVFPPYNEHFLHDVGAFQIGIGASLLLALRWRDGLMVALGAYAIGGGLHTVAHIIDSDLGGRAIDAPALAVLALLALVALSIRARELRESRGPRPAGERPIDAPDASLRRQS
jgi:hypothetical protein